MPTGYRHFKGRRAKKNDGDEEGNDLGEEDPPSFDDPNYDLVAPETTDANPPPSFDDPNYDLVAPETTDANPPPSFDDPTTMSLPPRRPMRTRPHPLTTPTTMSLLQAEMRARPKQLLAPPAQLLRRGRGLPSQSGRVLPWPRVRWPLVPSSLRKPSQCPAPPLS
jgi:hypothetical protein